jgi:hypothetical protein
VRITTQPKHKSAKRAINLSIGHFSKASKSADKHFTLEPAVRFAGADPYGENCTTAWDSKALTVILSKTLMERTLGF